MTPYEVSFLTSPQLANFILNRFVDVVFTLDIVLQFFLAYPEKHTFAGQGSHWVTDPAKIVRHYLYSWSEPCAGRIVL